MEKDFFRGFQIAFSRKMSVSRMELQKALNAMEYAEKSIMLSTVLCIVFPLVDVFYYIDNITAIGPVFAVMSLYLLYPAVLLLILLPVKGRLEQMVVSYMEEPEDSGEEQKEAESQRLYFALRSQGLTDRETEVARLAASGMSNVEIGRELYISIATVKKHMTHILEKMQCADREVLAERIGKM
ncbi:MAG: helix-turn-helix transcriptional regulator [Lachnospiraceae bacterium]|nr:helix-turn-helix transcriptional regulator [Lachnospiraceae bacterium]